MFEAISSDGRFVCKTKIRPRFKYQWTLYLWNKKVLIKEHYAEVKIYSDENKTSYTSFIIMEVKTKQHFL